MKELEAFGHLLNVLYAAALDDTRWQDVSRQIASLFETHSCALQIRSSGEMTLLGTTENVTPALFREYEQHYYQTDEWAKAVSHKRLGTVYVGAELVADKVLLRSECYEFLKKAEMFDVIGAAFSVGADEVGILGVHRSRQATAFDGGHRRKLELLLPRLRRALQIRSTFIRHRVQRDTALSVLDNLSTAIILADGDGKVLYANSAAIAVLRNGDGLTEYGGSLRADTPASTQALLRAVRLCAEEIAVARQPPPHAVALPRTRRSPLSVLVAPLRTCDLWAIHGIPIAMLIVRDAERAASQKPEILQALFGLTPAEAWLVGELLNGRDLKEIAECKGVSMNTVRTQLKSILHKTGTRRQAELIALVLKYTIDVAPPV
jgi:DNA-binding CsgD family transcriptional regulator/PAS domain-containing protein